MNANVVKELVLMLTVLLGMLSSCRSRKSRNFSYRKSVTKVFFGCLVANRKEELVRLDLLFIETCSGDLLDEGVEVLVHVEESNLKKWSI